MASWGRSVVAARGLGSQDRSIFALYAGGAASRTSHCHLQVIVR